jgi:formylglycine-generating enzyme required for sulfatase activity
MPLRKAVALNLRLILAGVLHCTMACAQQSATPPRTFTNSVGMKFVRIDPGSFRMGSAHMVTLSKGFYLQTTEVTQQQWEAVMGTNPSHFKGPDRPVETVSWEDAQEFLKKLNAKEKDSRYRLPSEAEWECACRAGGQEPDEAADLDEVAWWGENSSGATHPVGQKQPNAWGLFDMRGNVWEWVEDWYDGGGYAKSRRLDPTGPGSGDSRVLRGGSWDRGPLARSVYFRCAYRRSRWPTYRLHNNGFRCARTF